MEVGRIWRHNEKMTLDRLFMVTWELVRVRYTSQETGGRGPHHVVAETLVKLVVLLRVFPSTGFLLLLTVTQMRKETNGGKQPQLLQMMQKMLK